MKIVVHPNTDTSTLSEYFEFNGMPFEKLDLWNNNLDTFGRNTLDHDILKQDKTLLIINYDTLSDLCSWSVSKQELIDFCRRGNHVWVWNTMDSFVSCLHGLPDMLSDLDKQVPKEKITLFIDGTPTPESVICTWSNINIKIFPRNFFMFPSKIEKGTVKKVKCEYDFLLIMRNKRSKFHRQILWDKLISNPNLLSRGQTSYRAFNGKDDRATWIGKKPTIDYIPPELLASMDLYSNAWTELVPESLYKDGLYITEKTTKPISTKTPFLILSTPGYLNYLHTLGFKTFDTLISEKYDSEPNLETRVDMILEQLQDIIDNGAEDFYRACESILDHNHKKLGEHCGLSTYTTDLFITENLEQIGIS